MTNRKLSDEQERELSKEYASGVCSMLLAMKYKISIPTVLEANKRAGGQSNKRGNPINRARAQELYDKWVAGALQVELGEEYHISPVTVRSWLRKVNPGFKAARKVPVRRRRRLELHGIECL